MGYIKYEPSDGESCVAVTKDEMISLIETEPASYWNHPAGAGFAVLSWYSAPVTPPYVASSIRLLITAVKDIGFHVAIEHPKVGASGFAVAKCAGCEDTTLIEINYAGSWMRIARFLFIPLDQLKVIVAAFFDTGEPSDNILWITDHMNKGYVIEP